VNVLFGAGPRYENGEDRGSAILLNKLSFKPSKNFDEQRLASFEDKIVYESRCEHETLSYMASFYRERLEQSIELLSDSILYPLFNQEEINRTIDELLFNRDEQYMDPVGSAVLSDMNMEACFGLPPQNSSQGSLGSPTLFVNESATPEKLYEYQKKYFRPSNCVISGVGVKHDELVKLVKKYFKFEDAGNAILGSSSRFISGDKRLHFTDVPFEYQKQNKPALTGMILSFEGVNVYDRNSIFAIYVLESLLGGGNSFSSGGPGKGLQSLIYNEYLSRYRLFGMMAQHNSFRDTGVFSIQASAQHRDAKNIPLAITKLCTYMTRQLTDEYVNRAKVQFKTMILQGLEDNISLANSIGADVLYFNKYNGTDYLMSNIDKVTKEDIQRVMITLLTGKPPAIAVVGDLKKIPPKEYFDDYFYALSHHVKKSIE
jgi:processing peptidase subunit alpha